MLHIIPSFDLHRPHVRNPVLIIVENGSQQGTKQPAISSI